MVEYTHLMDNTLYFLCTCTIDNINLSIKYCKKLKIITNKNKGVITRI